MMSSFFGRGSEIYVTIHTQKVFFRRQESLKNPKIHQTSFINNPPMSFVVSSPQLYAAFCFSLRLFNVCLQHNRYYYNTLHVQISDSVWMEFSSRQQILRDMYLFICVLATTKILPFYCYLQKHFSSIIDSVLCVINWSQSIFR